MKMKKCNYLKEMIRREAGNTDKVYLYYRPDDDSWTAYHRSALNLVAMVPVLVSEVKELSMGRRSVYCLVISGEQMERYGLPFYCILLGDDYMELQKDSAELR